MLLVNKPIRIAVLICLVVSIGLASQAQCPISDFEVSSAGCSRQNIYLVNKSTGAISYEWDFCSGDFQDDPIANPVTTNSSLSQAWSMRIVQDNGSWYGFAISVTLNILLRFDFGESLNNTPSIIDLGNLSNALSGATDLQFVKEGSIWYAIVSNSGNNRLLRLTFGTSITSVPIAQDLGSFGSSLKTPNGLSIVTDLNNTSVFVANGGASEIIRLDYGNSLLNTPDVNVLPVPGGADLRGLSITRDCGRWYGLVLSYGNAQVRYLDFVNGLNQPFASGQITFFNSYNFPASISIINEGGEYYAFIQSALGNVYRLSFGVSIADGSGTGIDLGNLGVSNSNFAQTWVNDESDWFGFSIDRANSRLIRIKPPGVCDGNVSHSSNENPVIQYAAGGVKKITLKAFGADGAFHSSSYNVTISASISPDISFSSTNNCVDHNINFNSSASSPVVSYAWNFGDGLFSSESNPSHIYTSAGTYDVILEITSINSCQNTIKNSLKVYAAPTVSFNIPSVSPICTNNEFIFTNNTNDNFDGNLSYEWFVNNELKSTKREFSYTFTATGDQQVKLKASIPGCFSEQIQTLPNVQSGPVVGFSFTGKCEEENIIFTNESSGSISGYEWQFGNGNISSLENPIQTYADNGQYDVTLHTTGTNGCVSSLTQKVSIYSVPNTDFAIELPPFSCAGTPSQFNDLTPSMSDSNISTWHWTFGDSNNGTANVKNPQYLYSQANNYSVSLTTTTNFGCSNSTQKTITILPSPVADFTFGPACINQGTQFNDASLGSIKSWLWSIQSNTYSTQNPVHTFRSSATYPVTLTVTSTNNCVSQNTKSVLVRVPPTIEFTTSSTCANKPTEFNGISSGGNDSIEEWNWNFGDGENGGGQTPVHTYESVKTYSVKLDAKAISGCVYSYADEVSIINPPIAKFTVPLESGATPFTVPVTNTSSLSTKYSWKSGIINQPPIEAYSPSFTYTELGEYTIELEASNSVNCKDVAQQKIYVVVPEINAAITDFQLEKIPGSSAWNPVVTLENKSNIALIDPIVNLDISGNAAISEKISGIIKPNQSIVYTFNAKVDPRSVNYACAEVKLPFDNDMYDNRECVNVTDQFVSLIPYPNPAQDEITLEWISQSEEAMSVAIYNEAGQVVLSRTYEPILPGLNQVKLDVSQLSMGIYFVAYEWEGNSQHFRFSITR